jgi:hypothetical protein
MVAALVTGTRAPVSPAPFRLARFTDTSTTGATFVSSYLAPPKSGTDVRPDEEPRQ